MRSAALLFSFALSACNGPSADPGPAPSADSKRAYVAAVRRFLSLMEDNDKQCEAMLEDMKKADGGEGPIKSRLAKIRTNMEAASKLKPRKTDEENLELAQDYFPTFFSALEEFEKASWTPEESQKLWKNLQFRCTVCHTRFRD